MSKENFESGNSSNEEAGKLIDGRDRFPHLGIPGLSPETDEMIKAELGPPPKTLRDLKPVNKLSRSERNIEKIFLQFLSTFRKIIDEEGPDGNLGIALTMVGDMHPEYLNSDERRRLEALRDADK